ncbi:MAG TPA: hypothetical protein GYA11_06375, partial [Firmicutes bacterium]|nr:hypothetical protein [Bacillota bacterium]
KGPQMSHGALLGIERATEILRQLADGLTDTVVIKARLGYFDQQLALLSVGKTLEGDVDRRVACHRWTG